MKKEHGFTLLELLVSVAVVGVITSIAIPFFSDFRARSYDSMVISDVRNITAAQEAYYIDHERYASNVQTLSGFVSISNGTFVFTQGNSFGLPFWIVVAGHPSATKIFCYSNIADQKSIIADDVENGDCISLLTYNGGPIL